VGEQRERRREKEIKEWGEKVEYASLALGG